MSTQEAEPTPPERYKEPPASSLPRNILNGVGILGFLASGAVVGWIWSEKFHSIPSWKPIALGGTVSLSFGVLLLGMRAMRDAKRMSVARMAQDLVEEAWISHALGDVQKAEQQLLESLKIANEQLGTSDITTLSSLHALANLHRVGKQYASADKYYTQALELYQRFLPETHPARAELHYHIALNFEARKKIKEATDNAELALGIWKKMDRRSLDMAEIETWLGKIYLEQGQDERALELFTDAIGIQGRELGGDHATVLQGLGYLSRIYVKLRQFKESEKHLTGLIADLERSPDPNFTTLAEAHLDMGLIRMEQERPTEAEPHFVRSLQLLQHYVGPNERLLGRCLDGYRKIFANPEESTGQAGEVVNLIGIFFADREKIRSTLEAHPEWVNARDNTGWGPIQWSVFIGREDILGWLLNRGADPGYDSDRVMGPVHVACAWNRQDALLKLLEKNPDVNARGPGGWTPLFWCCNTGQHRLMDTLIKRGAKVNLFDDYQRTPLHLCTMRNHMHAVVALVGAGADVNALDSSGQTALHMAAERGHLAICNCLVFNGGQLNMPDKKGMTPLQLARKNKHKLLVKSLQTHLNQGLGKSPKG
ncbi:ankyrin repeat domain-containing protein [bacterium]|nr:ankyrin repeat domain-containing protein [bacterium]